MPSLARSTHRYDAALVLRDGSIFPGTLIGKRAEAVGELVFNTSMTGYQEALTDPSYAGQLLTFSYPIIGNYGIGKEAFESPAIHARACIVREACPAPTHRLSESPLDEFLSHYGVPGISGVDTRAIVKKVRSQGVMPAALAPMGEKILSNDEERNAFVASMVAKSNSFDYSKVDFVTTVATKDKLVFGKGGKKIVLIDCGAKAGIVRELLQRGMEVTVVPPATTSREILELNPHGVVISNGPGDPALMTYAIKTVGELLGQVPLFGICLGHQILGHAVGGKTFKLKFGHRGANHSVQDKIDGRVFITAQNHGFAVSGLPHAHEGSAVREWFANSNDGTNEGLLVEGLRAMSVQYHPEASPGPYDNRYLFDEFVKMI
ncbi:glutamine-hydrolyzing carbamoyl-phosphate synthase small subunit [Candidatus Micrarchaeota archaeon]|nr:glutamine-hydrolyzing carbamoyl-phosphate synthase small subunit [Candidatus Micrarchaeota archaeon]